MWGLWPLSFKNHPQNDTRFAHISEKRWLFLSISCKISFWTRRMSTERRMPHVLRLLCSVVHGHAIWHQIQQVNQWQAALCFASFWNTVFSPFYIAILSCCHCFVFESFKHYSDDCHWPPPPPPTHKVNVLKKTLLAKMLYCWMSEVMIYCRSYVLWNHSQETCVNTSSM